MTKGSILVSTDTESYSCDGILLETCLCELQQKRIVSTRQFPLVYSEKNKKILEICI